MILSSICIWTWHLKHEQGAMALSREDTNNIWLLICNISLIILHFLMNQPRMIEILERVGEEGLFLFLKYYVKQFGNCFISVYVQDLGYFNSQPLNYSLMMRKNSYSITLIYTSFYCLFFPFLHKVLNNIHFS